ncbi:MAG: 50S ribosomal protein L23 [Candidatus Woesearchaeota archaeon]
MSIIVKHPISTEKSIKLLESENTMIFIVDRIARKPEIKKEIEEIFKAKVSSVNTSIDKDGKKKAYVKFAPGVEAIDIATKLGLM